MTGSPIIQRWPIPFGAILFVLVAFSFFTLNPLEWALAACIGVLGAREVLIINAVPVQLAFVFPFLEIVTSLLDAEVNGSVMDPYFYGFGGEVYYMSMAGLVAVYLGWKLQLKNAHVGLVAQSEDDLSSLSLAKLIVLYFAFTGAEAVVDAVIPYGSSIKQLEKHVTVLAGTTFMAIVWRFKSNPSQKLLFFGFMLFALITSLFSFFSAWKQLFIVLGFTLLIQKSAPSAKVIRNLGMVFGVGLLFVLTWQGVKSEYRNFLNGGSKQQRIVVSQSEGLLKLRELVAEFWLEDSAEEDREPRQWYEVTSSEDAWQSTLERVGYLDLFSRMRQFVPSEMPHEDGALLKGNLTFALIPRILNPNKGVKNDQLKVEKYTKRIIADNASFSLGHYAEHYIDFGKFGMVLSLFIYGLLGGWLTRIFFAEEGVNRVIAASFCFYWLQKFTSFQFDAIKIYGLVFWALMTYRFLFRTILQKTLNWTRQSDST